MSALYAQNQPVDVTTVTAYLRNLNQLEKTGGVEYLFQLSESVPTIKHTPFYCKIIEDKAVLRRLIRQSERIVEGLTVNWKISMILSVNLNRIC